MRQPQVNDLVRLLHDLPQLSLHRGHLGVVRSTWFAPAKAFEVEFDADEANGQTRALLQADQFEVEQSSDMGQAVGH